MGTITLAKFSDIVGIDTKIGNTSALTSPSTTSIVNAINSIDTIGNVGIQIVPAEGNLNNYTTPGIYWASDDVIAGLVNAPSDLTYHESDDPLYDQWEGFKMIVSKLWEQNKNIWDGSAYTPTLVGVIKQEIIAGVGGDTTAHFGKRWERFYDIQTQTWGNWFIYLTAVDADNGYKYVARSRTYQVYDFGLNGIRIKRNQAHKQGYTLMNEDFTVGSSAVTGAGGGYHIRTSDDPIAFYGGGLTSDGDSYAQLYAQNSGDSLNSLQLTKKENGTNVVSVTSPSAWRSAIGAAPILQRVSIATNKSSTITNSANYNIASYTFQPGLWLISFRAAIQSNATGRRALFMSTSSTGTAIGAHGNTNQQATNGATTNLGWMTMISFTSSTKYYFNAYQNSGATLTCSSYISAIKLNE